MNSHSKHISKSWGLFAKHAPIALPLKALNISISILHNVARVFYTQVYNNNSSSLLETEFFFPISPDACFDSFEAKFNHITIKGVIKEKTQAQEEYKQAISSGKTAAYSEINKDTGDLMKISIGNIPPNSDVSITYSYIQKMETSLGKFWCFRLFSTFTPRYNGDLNEYLNKDIAILANYPTISSSQVGSYPWNIEVEIQSPSPIKFLDSPSHKVVTKYGNENHTCTITLDPSHNYKPNKDFVLLYSNGKENQVDCVLTPFEGGYCAMVTLLADFSTKEANEVFSNLAKAKQPEGCYSMDTIRGEYIFLIDRSGSMDGERINMAKSSLLLFLKSLPKNSYFNVVSFGSEHSFLHGSSQAYSEQALISAIEEVEEFSADMGGTEIYSALCKVFNSPLNKGYPRSIFLLTDGAVSNTQKVLNLIDLNSSKARVFTIGIGNGCSPELITKGASYGKGKHEFVQDNKDIHAKVISLLDASLSPSYSDLSLESDNFDAFVKRVTPNPASIPFLLNGEPITFFLMIRKEAFEENQKMSLKLKFYDTQIKKHRTIDVILDTDEAMENNLIPKLAIHDMLQRLEAPTEKKKISKKIIWTGETGMKGVLAELSSKYGVSCKDTALTRSEASTEKTENLEETIWTDKNDIKDALVELSLKYGILCKATAFFCEIAEGNNETKTLTPVRVLIPTISPQDYDSMFNPISASRFFAGQNTRQQVQKLEELKTKLAFRHSPCKKATPSRSSAAGFFESDDEDEDVTISHQRLNLNVRASVSSPSYLDVIMKQNFEGSWDPADQGIKQTVFTDGTLPALPKQLESEVNLDEEMWITVLILLWLEVRFQNEKQAWRLIHQKGCEWLKSKGVNYEELKELGRSVIKV